MKRKKLLKVLGRIQEVVDNSNYMRCEGEAGLTVLWTSMSEIESILYEVDFDKGEEDEQKE